MLIINHIINLRRSYNFQSINVGTIRYRTESLTYLANKICSQIPTDIKEAPTLEVFKAKIKYGRYQTAHVGSVKLTYRT